MTPEDLRRLALEQLLSLLDQPNFCDDQQTILHSINEGQITVAKHTVKRSILFTKCSSRHRFLYALLLIVEAQLTRATVQLTSLKDEESLFLPVVQWLQFLHYVTHDFNRFIETLQNEMNTLASVQNRITYCASVMDWTYRRLTINNWR
ncbi:MAG: hypothetical protein ACRC5C_11135, partial [Bacilli bacterium]